MLTKNELLKKFPNPSLEDLKKDRVPIQQKKNIIKNAILKEEVPLKCNFKRRSSFKFISSFNITKSKKRTRKKKII